MFLGIALLGTRPDAQFRSGVSLVEVYATVTDSAGEPVTGLTAADFVVRDEGVPQTVSAFVAGEFPLSLALAVDRSFSVPRLRLKQTLAGLDRFVQGLRPEDQLMVVAIGSVTDVLAPLSADRAAASEALRSMEPWGTTPLFDAALGAIRAIQAGSGRRALILVSDGDERYSEATAADVLTAARESDVLIYPIAVGARRPGVFAEMAAVSGGRSFHMEDPRRLPAALDSIHRELRAQYLLGYSPDAAAAPGWHAIQVTVQRPGARVRARDGYVSR